MTRSATLVGYAVIAAVMATYQLIGLVTHRTPTIGELVGAVCARPAVRAILFAGWLWLGWHLFDRAHIG